MTLIWKTVKKVIGGISEPLTYIWNVSFQTGSFPNKMKTEKVVLLYKTGDRHHFTNYRPVSSFPKFFKILETLFISRLDKFIDKHKLLWQSINMDSDQTVALIESIDEMSGVSGLNCTTKTKSHSNSKIWCSGGQTVQGRNQGRRWRRHAESMSGSVEGNTDGEVQGGRAGDAIRANQGLDLEIRPRTRQRQGQERSGSKTKLT